MKLLEWCCDLVSASGLYIRYRGTGCLRWLPAEAWLGTFYIWIDKRWLSQMDAGHASGWGNRVSASSWCVEELVVLFLFDLLFHLVVSVWRIVLHLCGNVLHNFHSAKDIQILRLGSYAGPHLVCLHSIKNRCGCLQGFAVLANRGFSAALDTWNAVPGLILDLF